MPYTLVSPPPTQDAVPQAAPRRFRLVQPPEDQNSVAGSAKSIGSGLLRGASAVAGLPGDLKELVGAGVKWAGRKAGFEPGKIPLGVTPGFVDMSPPTSRQTLGAVEGAVGPLYEPKTTLEKYLRTGGEFAPAMLAGPGGLARRAVRNVAAPAAGSEAAGQATEGTALEPYARVAGAIAGGAAPAVASRAVTPLPISPARQQMVDTLRAEGVHPTAGQVTGRKGLQNLESEMGGGAVTRALEAQDDAYTGAILRRVGENAPRAMPEVIDRAFRRLGNEFNQLERRNTVVLDNQLVTDLRAAVQHYQDTVPPVFQTGVVEGLVRDIATRLRQGHNQLAGTVYQPYRSRIGAAGRAAAARGDTEHTQALYDIQNALDEGMERSMVAAGRPDDVTAWQEARRQYRNLMVVVPAALGPGEAAAMGAISPAKLRQTSSSGSNRRGYVRGQGDFSELARAGQAILTPLPNSGTAGRTAVRNLGTGASTVAGAVMGGHAGGPVGGGMGAIAGAAAPYIAGRAAMSGPGQAYLQNQLLAGGANVSQEAYRAALMQSLLAPHLFPPPQKP